MTRTRLAASISVCLAALLGCKDETPGPAARAAPSANRPPEATLVDVSAPTLLAAIRKSPYRAVFVNVWASWCGPCKRELPMLRDLSVELAPRGVAVWFVSVDDPDAKPKALEALRAAGIAGPTLYATGALEAFKQAINPRWPGMIPASFLFDGTGKLRYFWGGPVYESDVQPIVDGFLSGRVIDGEADFTLAPGKTSP